MRDACDGTGPLVLGARQGNEKIVQSLARRIEQARNASAEAQKQCTRKADPDFDTMMN